MTTSTNTQTSRGELSSTAARHLLLNMTPNGSLGRDGENVFVVRRGEGPYVDDMDGRRYIDGLSGLYCCQLGYSYAGEFADAADRQLRELCFSPLWSSSAHPTAIELAERLARIAPVDIEHTFFSGGGAEAVETAWKIARKYHAVRGEPGRTKAISRRGAYHGLTLGALSLTDDPGLKEPYGPPAIETRFVSHTNRFGLSPEFADDAAYTAHLLAELEAAILAEGPETIAMLIAEPVQNRGGCITPPDAYWPGLRDLADRYGFLLVADEVITAFGRLGEWFGGDRYGARPDIVTVAKGITAGYAPMGATLVGTRVAEVINQPGVVLNHGYTFGGHPLSAAIALRNLEIMERDRILENVQDLQDHLGKRMASLAALPIVGDVRGAGFFYALELVGDVGGGFTDAARAALVVDLIPRRLREAGLLARVYNRAAPLVQIAPPLISDRQLLDRIADIIADTLDEASARLH